jgi:hypothetical protein
VESRFPNFSLDSTTLDPAREVGGGGGGGRGGFPETRRATHGETRKSRRFPTIPELRRSEQGDLEHAEPQSGLDCAQRSAAQRCAQSNPGEYWTPGRAAVATSSGARYRGDNYLPQAANVHGMHNSDDPESSMFLETSQGPTDRPTTMQQPIQRQSSATPTDSHSLRSSVLESPRESWPIRQTSE